MLRDQKRDIPLNGGPDTWLLRPWHLDLFKPITINELMRQRFSRRDGIHSVGVMPLQGTATVEKALLCDDRLRR